MGTNNTTPLRPGAGQMNPAVTSGSYPTPSAQTNRPDRPEWTAAKTAGSAGEQIVADVLRALGMLVEQLQGHAPFDLAVAGRIEVKTDLRAVHTGNVAVEVQFRGHQAGITTSSATGWVFVVGRELLLLPTAALRELVRRGGYRFVQSGEGAVCALVPLADLRRVARSISISEGVRR